jgi:hypothetical protein
LRDFFDDFTREEPEGTLVDSAALSTLSAFSSFAFFVFGT